MDNMVTLYSAIFKGRFGRNRSDKMEAGRNHLTQEAALEEARGWGLKKGILHVVAYHNCEDKGNGLYVIPITQGKRCYEERIGE